MSHQPPIRRFFVIGVNPWPGDGSPDQRAFYDYARGLWWSEVSNATHFATYQGAEAVILEMMLPISQCFFVAISEHAQPDTMVDDDGDVDHGEEWKKGV